MTRGTQGLLLLALLVGCGEGPTIWNPGDRDLSWGPDGTLDVAGDQGGPDLLADADRDVLAGDDSGLAEEAGNDSVPDPGEPEDGWADLSDSPSGDPAGDGTAEDWLQGSDETGADDEAGSDGSQGPEDPGKDPGLEDAPADVSGGGDAGPGDEGPLPVGLRIRFIAANLTSGSDQSWDPGHGLRILQGLRGDVVLVQEFNYGSNTTQDYRRFTDQACGTECSWSVGSGQIPNGVVSRWPIVESGAWDDPAISNRDLDWARIDLPGPRDLFVVSVHLHTSPSSDQVRAAQVVAREVVAYRNAHPGCCWYVVGGDFNGTAAVSTSGFGAWQGEEVFYVRPPHPVGEDGSTATNRNRSSQYDFVLLDTDLVRFQVPACCSPMQGAGPDRCYPPGLVFDTRDFSQAILDQYFPPTLTSDSNASNMQHMAVVKDVVIQ
ncbi:MAG TPA: endonuclease [Myxococcota bacterium]|nr:endonuclease [Myxococcota bacterium]HQK52223.1 endonuclease [Myxococcota bacterium]